MKLHLVVVEAGQVRIARMVTSYLSKGKYLDRCGNTLSNFEDKNRVYVDQKTFDNGSVVSHLYVFYVKDSIRQNRLAEILAKGISTALGRNVTDMYQTRVRTPAEREADIACGRLHD